MELDGFLKQNKVIGIEGIDTKALTRSLRNHGSIGDYYCKELKKAN